MENQHSVFFVRKEFALSRPAPASTVGVLGWIRSNLFSTPFNSLLTVLMGGFGVWLIWGALDWLILNAVWTGGNEACKANPKPKSLSGCPIAPGIDFLGSQNGGEIHQKSNQQ